MIADIAAPDLLADLRGRVTAVVCNPPYVPEHHEVAPEVAHDPHTAVFAGADGLTVIRPALARAAELLAPGGVLALEHDDALQGVVFRTVAATGDFTGIAAHRDLAGQPRYVTAVRSPRGACDPGIGSAAD